MANSPGEISNHLAQNIDRWLSVDEIANYLGVSKDTLYTWINKGLPAYKVGRLWRLKLVEVDSWIRSHKHF